MFRNGTKSYSRDFLSSGRVAFIWLRPIRQPGTNAHTDSSAYRNSPSNLNSHSNPDACFNSDRTSDNDAFPDPDALSDPFSHPDSKSLRQPESQLDSGTYSASSPPSPASQQAHAVNTMEEPPTVRLCLTDLTDRKISQTGGNS
jgi:hypothetical protein